MGIAPPGLMSVLVKLIAAAPVLASSARNSDISAMLFFMTFRRLIELFGCSPHQPYTRTDRASAKALSAFIVRAGRSCFVHSPGVVESKTLSAYANAARERGVVET